MTASASPLRFQNILLAIAATALLPASLFANIFVEFKNPTSSAAPPLTGESTVQGFANQIIATSCQFGAGTSVALSSKGFQASKPSLSEVTLTKDLDKASPKMFEALVGGGVYRDVTISFTRTEPGEAHSLFYTIKLKDAIFTSYSSQSGGDLPSESFSLKFTAIEQSYIPFNSQGVPQTAVVGRYNLLTGRIEFRDAAASAAVPVVPRAKPASTGTEITVE